MNGLAHIEGPSDAALDRACAEIEARWSRFVSKEEAREQADQFRTRCKSLAAVGLLTETELDATLEIVADMMASA